MFGSTIQPLTSARIVGSSADDVLVGTDQGEQFGAREGNDQVFAGGGGDTVFAGAGNDTVFAGSGADRVYAGIGNDQVFGGLDSDILYGGEGNDTLYVGEGADTVYAGAGNDLVGAGAGNDVLYGGVGNDTIYSAAGNDSTFGGVGDDVLYGGDGNDTIRPGAGNDTVFGGAGTDIAVLSGSSEAYSWSGDGTVTTIGPDGTDVLNGVEYLKFDDATVYIGPDNGGGNRPPVGVADSYTVEAGTTTVTVAETGVLANDSDPDNDSLTAVLGTGPTNGALVLNDDGSFSYTPNANFTGADSFTYRPNDGTANGSPVTVSITVDPVVDITRITSGANSNSSTPVISADGSTIAFSSRASNLIPGHTDTNGSTPDILLYNQTTGAITNITEAGNLDSYAPVISADGSTIAFESYASNLVSGHTDANGNTLDIFVYDAASGVITNITEARNDHSYNPVISADGSTVAFVSQVPYLIPGQTNAYGFTQHIFICDVATGEITNITEAGDSSSYAPVISADGSTIAFVSYASNLVAGQTDANGSTEDIFVYDVATGAITNITEAGNSDSSAPVISADGSIIAFQSPASNLVAGQTDANGSTEDIFVYDVATGEITNITEAGNLDSFAPVISADGSIIAFTSNASNLIPGHTDANGSLDVFVYDVATGAITNITEAGNGSSSAPVISADGSTIAFLSRASNLVPGQTDANGSTLDIFVYDVATGEITNITEAGNGSSANPVLSADGSTGAFSSYASNLTPDHTAAPYGDIYLFDM